jgi:hypothetical protein
LSHHEPRDEPEDDTSEEFVTQEFTALPTTTPSIRGSDAALSLYTPLANSPLLAMQEFLLML